MTEVLAPIIKTTQTTTTTSIPKRRSRSGVKRPTETNSHAPILFSTTQQVPEPSTQKHPSKNNSMSAKKQPSTAGSTSEADAGGLNPYLSLVFRRMRRLRKRVTRVESTEAVLTEDPSQKDKLEPDQLVALEKKLEISAPLKELEDLFKAMTVLQASDKLEHKKQIEGHLHDIQKSMETATKDTQDSATSAFIQVIRLFYALKQLDDARQYLTLPLSNSLEVLEKFRFRLFEVAQEAELSDEDNCAHSRQELYSMVHKLAEKSTDNVVEEGDITYKHVFDELDHLTFPSAKFELRDTPFISDDCQMEDPSSTVRIHTGKDDSLDRVSVRSLMSRPKLTSAQKPCATVENWFNNISPSNPPSSEFPSEPTPGQKSKGATQDMSVKQAESAPVAQASLGREVALQTDSVIPTELSSLPAAVPMAPTVVPMVPVHPMPDYRFMLPPWVAESLPQAQQGLSSMHDSNEPGHLTFSQPGDKDSSKSGSCRRFGRRFGRPSNGPSQESSAFRSHPVSQESNGQGGDTRQLGVIYEDDEKECSAGTSARIHGHSQYVSYYPGPIYQEPEQLQVADPNQRGIQGRMVARTRAEGAASGVRRGVSPLSGDQLRQQQQQDAYDHSSGVMTLQQSESTSFGNKVSGTSNNNESPKDNNGGFQGRRSGKKKGSGQNRSSLGQSQQHGGTKSQGQRSTEPSSQLRPYAQQQQHPIDNSGHYLQFQQRSSSCSYDHNQSNEQSQHYYRHKTQLQQQQQQRHHHDEQELSHLPGQQPQQQGLHHYVQQPFYQYPGGWYYPGYGGGATPVYCVQGKQRQQGQQVQQTQQEDANEGQV